MKCFFDGRPVWFGADTFNLRVGRSYTTGRVTHEPRRIEIDRSEPQRIGDLLRHHERPAKRLAAGLLLPVQAVCGQTRQIERENSPFRFRGNFHRSPIP